MLLHFKSNPPLQYLSDRDGQEARCEGSDPLRDLRGERVTGRVTEELHQADDAQEDRLLELARALVAVLCFSLQ